MNTTMSFVKNFEEKRRLQKELIALLLENAANLILLVKKIDELCLACKDASYKQSLELSSRDVSRAIMSTQSEVEKLQKDRSKLTLLH